MFLGGVLTELYNCASCAQVLSPMDPKFGMIVHEIFTKRTPISLAWVPFSAVGFGVFYPAPTCFCQSV